MKKLILLFLILSTFSYAEKSWHPTSQLSGGSEFIYAMTSSHSEDLYASVWAVGIFKSTNNGISWNPSGLDGKRVSFITCAPNGDLYALSKTVSYVYIHRSTNGGETWEDVHTELFELNYAAGGAIVFPSDGSIVAAFAVTVGPTIGDVASLVYKSTNDGSEWFRTQVIHSGFVGGMEITADNKILIGSSLSGVFYSVNNGNTFAQLNTFPAIFIRTIIKSPDNTIYVSDAFGLHRSIDNGLSWTDVGSQNSTAYLRSAFAKSNTELFISTDDKKVFRSTNRGDQWIQINEGLPANANVYCFTSANGKMFAGTNNSGVFVYDDLTSLNENVTASNFVLHQNYPNPFNPKTIINYELGIRNFVSIKIFNSLGAEISTLVSEVKLPGAYSVEWDGSKLPSGVYFCKLESETFTDVKRMLLVK